MNKTSDKLPLYIPLKAGYTKKAKDQRQALNPYGYVRDNQLSKQNNNVQVYYNPNKQKVLVNTNGTNTVGDWLTNAKLGSGVGYKESARYNATKSALTKAKKKYGPNKEYILTGHSQSGAAVNYAASQSDKAYTYNPAYTVGQKIRPNVQNYRTKGDVVSLLAPKKTTKTLQNKGSIFDVLGNHDLKNIKNEKIYVD